MELRARSQTSSAIRELLNLATVPAVTFGPLSLLSQIVKMVSEAQRTAFLSNG